MVTALHDGDLAADLVLRGIWNTVGTSNEVGGPSHAEQLAVFLGLSADDFDGYKLVVHQVPSQLDAAVFSAANLSKNLIGVQHLASCYWVVFERNMVCLLD